MLHFPVWEAAAMSRIGAWLRSEAADCAQVLVLTGLTLGIQALLAIVLPLILLQGFADPLVIDLQLAALYGLAAGAGARLILRRRTLLLQLAASSAGLLLSLGVLGYLSGGRMGAAWSGTRQTGDLVRLFIGMPSAWLPVMAFRRARRAAVRNEHDTSAAVARESGLPELPARTGPDAVQSSAGSRPAGRRESFSRPGKAFARSRKAAEQKLSALGRIWKSVFHRQEKESERRGTHRIAGSNGTGVRKRQAAGLAKKQSVRVRKPAGVVKANASRRTVSNRHSGGPGMIALNGMEEHRCPFCLEDVVEKDPRGVTVCPVCNTWHHADCWAVTGTCQVPHKHE
jgi:hypothetical protein